MLGGASPRCSSRIAATCDSDSSISTAGISGAPGKVALEELLVDGDVLDGDQPPARLVLGDGVDEHRRIPVAQAIQRLRDVDRHGASVYQKAAERLTRSVDVVIGDRMIRRVRLDMVTSLSSRRDARCWRSFCRCAGAVATRDINAVDAAIRRRQPVTETFAGTLTPNGADTLPVRRASRRHRHRHAH